jgi:large subunit ribosomal protein L24e
MFCSFCNNEIRPGTGTLFVYKDGTSLAFCSSKCRKNLIGLGREGRLERWTSKVVALTGEKKKAEKKESALAKDIEAKLAEKAAKKEEKK